MSPPARRGSPIAYRLRVAGHLDHRWSPWFGAPELTHQADGTTCLTGVVADQAALHGLLLTIRDLGITLISVAAGEAPDEPVTQPPVGRR